MVDHEKSTISPSSDAATKQPFGVAAAGNSKFLFELRRGELGFRFGVRRSSTLIAEMERVEGDFRKYTLQSDSQRVKPREVLLTASLP